ncbi:hypothetical protein PV325_006825 [Microctonus aethiopoides]|nr:hypothetical protein PV325_006825 [Microctonus aethiopoides]
MQESQELLRTGQTVMADFLPEIFHPDEIDINSSLPDEPEAPDDKFSGPQLGTCPTTTSAVAEKMREERMLLPRKK